MGLAPPWTLPKPSVPCPSEAWEKWEGGEHLQTQSSAQHTNILSIKKNRRFKYQNQLNLGDKEMNKEFRVLFYAYKGSN